MTTHGLPSRARRKDARARDLVWLGVLLSVVSALLMIVLVYLLVT